MAVARALFAFQGEEDTDLSFRENDIIKILKQDESGWWLGQTADGRQGEFPFNYVELIDQVEATRLQAGPDFRSRVFGGGLNAAAADKIDRVQVDPVPNSARFNIQAILKRKTVEAVKTVGDFRMLDATLRALFPNFDSPLPPMWADKVFESEGASQKRARVLEIYLEQLVGQKGVEATEFALISWMNPRASFNCQREARELVDKTEKTARLNNGSRNSLDSATARATVMARAAYTWDANDAVELSLQRGTLVAVRNQNTLSPGWWEGETSDGLRGLFPSNYVTMLTPDEAKNVIRATDNAKPVPKATGTFDASNNMFTSPTTNNPQPMQMGTGNSSRKPASRQKKTENNFSMPSLDAFDELLQDGFTMLQNDKLLIPRNGASSPREGDNVVLGYVAYVWDCQKQRLIEFASSDLPDKNNFVGPLQFTVGSGQQIKALERAVQNLETGQSSRVVVRPDMGYGEVGDPPNVPPNCHLIYDVTLESFQSGGGGNQQGMGLPQSDNRGNTFATSSYGIVRDRQRRPNQTRQPNPIIQEDTNGAKYSLEKMQDIVAKKAFQQYGVSMNFVEEQLTDEGFAQAFQCSREEFMLMPKWKRIKLKQDANLY